MVNFKFHTNCLCAQNNRQDLKLNLPELQIAATILRHVLLLSMIGITLWMCIITNAWCSSDPIALNLENTHLLTSSIRSFTTRHFSSKQHNNKYLQFDIQISNAIPSQKFISPGVYGGMSMDVKSFNTTSPPDLHVEFIVQTLDNMIVKQTGVNRYMRIKWSIHSSDATTEPSFNPDSWIPSPGNSLHFNDAPIYIGSVTNGCGNVLIYPINFYSEVYSGAEILGNYSATDINSIKPNGYWNFSYTIRVSDIKGNISDIIVKGIIRAMCEW